MQSVDDGLALCFGGVDCFSEGSCLVTGENEDDVSGEYHHFLLYASHRAMRNAIRLMKAGNHPLIISMLILWIIAPPKGRFA